LAIPKAARLSVITRCVTLSRGARRRVEEQDPRPVGQRPGDQQALALPARERTTAETSWATSTIDDPP
jgi:hypothetical protein